LKEALRFLIARAESQAVKEWTKPSVMPNGPMKQAPIDAARQPTHDTTMLPAGDGGDPSVGLQDEQSMMPTN